MTKIIYNLLSETLVFQKMISLNASITENEDAMGIFFGGSSAGATVQISCTYATNPKASQLNVTVVPQSYNVEGELGGFGDFSEALSLNFYATANFDEVVYTDAIIAGQTVYAGVQWNVDEPVDGINFYLSNCSVITTHEALVASGYASTDDEDENAVTIIQDTCYSTVVSAIPIGPKISSKLPKFSYKAFLYNTKREQSQHLECYVSFCLVEECAGVVAMANEDCPADDMKYSFDGY